MDQWYVARGNAKKGPFTAAQLRTLAKKGQLRVSDMLLREGSQKWVAAGKFAQLFPVESATPDTSAPAEPATAPPPSDPLSAPMSAFAKLKPFWLWIGAGSIVCLLALIPLFFLGRGSSSDSPGKKEPIAKNAKQPEHAEQPVPKKDELPGKKAEPGVEPVPPAAKDNVELPPVAPTKVAAGDAVMAKFKKARAAYLEARMEAPLNVRMVFDQAYDEIDKGNLDAAAKAKAKQAIMIDHRSYRVPTHPVAKKAVEEYTRFIETATRTFGNAAEEALAAYEKQGVTDPEKLRPLLAGRLCARHADLIGAWVRSSEDPAHFNKHEAWIVDFDERTGGFQVEGIERDNNSTYAVFHGEKIEFKDGALCFSAVHLNPENGRIWANGVPVTISAQKGTLKYEMRDRVTGSDFDAKKGELVWLKKTVAGELHRTLDFGSHIDGGSDFVHLIYHLNKRGSHGLEHKPVRPLERLDTADANSVWRRLALLASFGYVFHYEDSLIAHEQLYLPYRSGHPDFENRNPRLTADLLRQYETLADCPHPYLKRAAAQAFVLCRNRLRLAQANEEYGNTAGSSIREFQQKIFVPAMEYSLLREKDRQDAQREYPGSFVYSDGPLSRESQEKLEEFLRGVGNLQTDVQDRAQVSGLLAYADMAEVDRTVAFWQKQLLPLAKRCAGPKSEQPLISLEGGWRKRSSSDPDQRLSVFGLQNVGDQELTHAVVEIIAENDWGEKAAHYCYLPHLDIGESVSVLPHARWDKRRLDFTNTMKVTWSVWADQGAEIDRQATLTSPSPHPDAARARTNYLRFDTQLQPEGEALGTMMQRTTTLPGNTVSQRLLLREASKPGNSYLFRLPEEGKPARTLLLRFRPGPEAEVEIVDPRTHEPFQAKTPVWKGKLDDQGGPSIFFGADGNWEESGWAFALGLDDQPMIHCPGGGNGRAPFPVREIPLFPAR